LVVSPMIGLYLVKFRVLDCEEWRYKFAIEKGKLSVASLGGRTAPGDTLQGVTPE